MEGAFYQEEVDKPEFESSAANHVTHNLHSDRMVGALNMHVEKLRKHIRDAVTAAKDLTNMINHQFPSDERKSLLIRAYGKSPSGKSEFYSKKMLGDEEKQELGILQELSNLEKEIHSANEFFVSLNNNVASEFNSKYEVYLKRTKAQGQSESQIRTIKFLSGKKDTQIKMESQKKNIEKGANKVIENVGKFTGVLKNGHREKLDLISKFIADLKTVEDKTQLSTQAIVNQTSKETMSLDGNVKLFYETYNKQAATDKTEFYNEISDEIGGVRNEES